MNNSNESFVGDPMVSQPEHAYHQIISTNNQSDQINAVMQTRLPVPERLLILSEFWFRQLNQF